MNGEQRTTWYFTHGQDDLNLHTFGKFEGTFLLDAVHLMKSNNCHALVWWYPPLQAVFTRQKQIYQLTLSVLAKNFSRRNFETFFLANWIWNFMRIVSDGDNLHEILKPFFSGNNKIISSICRLLNFSGWHYEIFFLFFFFFFSENRFCHCMQMVSIRDSLHEMAKHVLCET